MLPKPPPREGQLGFLYLPPYRVQGYSIAGEATSVMIPELDLCFDAGMCPRAALPAKHMCISHGHMDHVGGLAYFCSQRRFQGMGDATIVCDLRIADNIRAMMAGMAKLEHQNTPYELIALEPEQEIEIKNNIYLRGFHTDHRDPSMGYSVLERRTKLKDEFQGLPQEKLRELKERGTEITRELRIPLVSYLGDTSPGAFLVRDDVRQSKIILTECTFFEPEHKGRAGIGKHLHVDDIVEWIRVCECDAMVLLHVSRRTHLSYARRRLEELMPEDKLDKVFLLMDHRTNRGRYDRQVEEAEAAEAERTG